MRLEIGQSMKKHVLLSAVLLASIFLLSNCGGKDDEVKEEDPKDNLSFVFGADLSYVNQILDHNGIYKDGGNISSPYKIFKDKGTNLVRLRLWHNPTWTKEIYGPAGKQLYNDLKDVEKSIKLCKEQGLSVLLDLHYSDSWADPEKQEIPGAWTAIRSLSILKDSVYQYTFKTLKYLDQKGLMPEMVQIGNETNCGMLYSNAPQGFPSLNVCDGSWTQLGEVVNSAIKAVKDASANSTVKTKIALHVADPKNVDWWFTNVLSQGKVTDFDILGFSYYPIWHPTIPIENIATTVASFKSKFKKEVIILETAFPWTDQYNDSYNNSFGGTSPFGKYPFTIDGQYSFMVDLTQAVIDGGGSGVIYWEPGWISSGLKDQWGTGSSWENATFFDFSGNPVKAIEYPSFNYIVK
jgi:arabinogalactan endo-1,4-beta-galactosidase